MVQRKVLALDDIDTQVFDELVADDIPDLSGAYDAAGSAAAAQAAAIAASQPVDSDLTAIAALATTAFGRSILAAADPADATKYWDGSGAFSVPPGGSGLSHPQVLARTLGA